jgi:two-component system, OmpR family, phosphate regulon sensor histidine kinase PhoR
MKENRRIRILAVVTIAYILLALSWWSVLLYQKNQALFDREREVHFLMYGQEDPQGLAGIQLRHTRQTRMILGESVFILVSILIGVWLMTRGFLEEIRINRQRRNFLFSITHELKTPVAAIRLVLDSLQRKEWPEAQKQKLLRSGLRESDRLQSTLDDLLLAARLEHTYLPRAEQRAAGETLLNWLEDIRHSHPERALLMEGQTERDQELFLDWPGLQVIFRNLTENALKYSPAGSPVHIRYDWNPETFVLEVRDEGPGIPEAERDRIFQMFYRLGDEDRRQTKGSGLGLYLAREIARRNGGDIRVRENTPHGSLFTLQMPCRHEAHPAG